MRSQNFLYNVCTLGENRFRAVVTMRFFFRNSVTISPESSASENHGFSIFCLRESPKLIMSSAIISRLKTRIFCTIFVNRRLQQLMVATTVTVTFQNMTVPARRFGHPLQRPLLNFWNHDFNQSISSLSSSSSPNSGGGGGWGRPSCNRRAKKNPWNNPSITAKSLFYPELAWMPNRVRAYVVYVIHR